MQIIGVTGTNGKTSCCQFVAQLLDAAQIKCGIIGTTGSGFIGDLTPNLNTTPDPILLQEQLANLHAQGAKAIAIEVSSHALDQFRVAGVDFVAAIFTNLTRDHLDYHGTMESYADAKRKLFCWPNLQYAIINADDKFGCELLQEFPNNVKAYAYSVSAPEITGNKKIKKIFADKITLDKHGINAHITTPWGEAELQSSLFGSFNLSNLLAALTCVCALKVDFTHASANISTLVEPTGRMQTFGGSANLPLVIVDFAHTPDGLSKALHAIREHFKDEGEIWCVFGCGGGRDHGKRPLMGEIAERESDHIIITNDNPRMEDATQIINDIVAGLLCPWAAEIEQDRATAIAYAINSAQSNDVVIIAGKGHENYQLVGDQKLIFSDIAEVQKNLSALKSKK